MPIYKLLIGPKYLDYLPFIIQTGAMVGHSANTVKATKTADKAGPASAVFTFAADGPEPVADFQGRETTYLDTTAACGQVYFVTAYNAKGQSAVSPRSYYSPVCR